MPKLLVLCLIALAFPNLVRAAYAESNLPGAVYECAGAEAGAGATARAFLHVSPEKSVIMQFELGAAAEAGAQTFSPAVGLNTDGISVSGLPVPPTTSGVYTVYAFPRLSARASPPRPREPSSRGAVLSLARERFDALNPALPAKVLLLPASPAELTRVFELGCQRVRDQGDREIDVFVTEALFLERFREQSAEAEPVAAELRADLRARFFALGTPERAKAVGAALASVAGLRAVQRSPALRRALLGAAAVAMRPLLVSTSAIVRTLRFSRVALALPALAAWLWLEQGGASAEAAEAGGAGYFFTLAGVARLLTFDEQNFRHFTEHDDVLRAFLRALHAELARARDDG